MSDMLHERVRRAEAIARKQQTAPTVPLYGLSAGSGSGTPKIYHITGRVTGDNSSGVRLSYVLSDATMISSRYGAKPLSCIASDGFGTYVCGTNGHNDTIIYSSDGINWTDLGLSLFGADSNGINDIEYSDTLGLFAAGGGVFEGTTVPIICTSPDGLTWTPRSTPWDSTYGEVYKIVWSDGLGAFFAVGEQDTSSGTPTYQCLLISTDGITWTQIDTSSLGVYQMNCIGWSPDLGVLVACGQEFGGSDDNYIFSSSDGTTWTQVASYTPSGSWGGQYNDVAWSPKLGLFCVVSLDINNAVWTSPDGTTWTQQSIDTFGTNGPECVGWCSLLGMFIAYAPSYMWGSVDGAIWVRDTNSNIFDATDMYFENETEDRPAGPHASFTWVDNHDGTVTFTSTSTGDPTLYTWDFGDGGGSSGSSDFNPTHTYSGPGPWTVTLTASTFFGSDMATDSTVTASIVINNPTRDTDNSATGSYSDDNTSVTDTGSGSSYDIYGNGIFYKWTAPANGTVTVRTDSAGSSSPPDIGDTVLYVLPNNTSFDPDTAAIAFNDDDHGPTGYSGSPYYSLTTFTAVAGTTYYFFAKGYDTSERGTFVVSWTY